MAQEPEPEPKPEPEPESEDEEPPRISDSALRGLRRLFRQVEYDIDQEQEPDDSEDESEPELELEPNPIPSFDFVAEKLIAQGVNYEQLLKVVLLEHDEYAFTEAYDEASDNLFEKIRSIIVNFQPEHELRDNGFLHRIAENANMMYESQLNGQMPCFQNMSTHVLKTICRQNGIRTDLEKSQMLRIIESLWINLNDQNLNDQNLNDQNLNDQNLNDQNLNDQNLNDQNLNDQKSDCNNSYSKT